MKLGVGSIILGNIGSKGVGILREVLFAAWFGTGGAAAAFRIGQTGLLLPVHALIGDSLSAGLLPLYRQMQQEGGEGPRVLVMAASLYGLAFSAVVTSLLWLFAERVALLIAPGASAPVLELAGSLLRIMALATPFYVLSGMLSYLETAYGRYGAVAWRPMLLNIGSIGGAALAVWLKQDHWLATGILISHVAFFGWTMLQLSRLDRFLPEGAPALSVLGQVSARMFAAILPLMGLPLIAQANVLVERIVSSWLGTEVIPAVDYARFICDTTVQLIAVPLGILTMSVHGGTAAAEMRAHVVQVARAIMVIAFPLSVFVGMNAEAIVRLMFARGAFDAQSVATTSIMLVGMGAALGMTVTAYYLIKALNAQLRNREALIFMTTACAVSITINVTLWPILGPAVIGLAVAGHSLTLIVLSVRALRLSHDLYPICTWMVPGLVAHVGLSFALRIALDPGTFGSLAANIAVATILWGGVILFAPPLRAAARPVLSRVPGLRRLAG